MNNKGFTLIEIIVAVALVAILSAAIAPSVLNNIAQGRTARAQSDVQAIGAAIARFKVDTGVYPRLAKGAWPDTLGNRIGYLASAAGNFPANTDAAKWSGGTFTNGTITDKSVEDFTNHLIMGSSRWTAVDSLYPRADKPDDPNSAGFRSGVISADQADPWGNKYIANVRVLGVAGQPVWVISAGPNGVFDTVVNTDSGGYAPEVLSGDDIGFRIQ